MCLNKLVLAAGFTIKTWQRSSWAIVLTYFSLKLLVLFLFFILSSWGLFMLMFYVWIFIALCNHNLKDTLGRGVKFFLLKFEHSQFSSSRLFLVLLFCFHQNIGNIVRSWLATQIITFLKKGLDISKVCARVVQNSGGEVINGLALQPAAGCSSSTPHFCPILRVTEITL